MLNETIDPELAAFLGDPPPEPIAKPTAGPPAFLDGIGEAKPKGKRKEYPQFPDADGQAGALAKRSLELAGAADQLSSNNRLLGDMILPYWMRYWNGKPDTESGIRVESDMGAVLVICQARTKKLTSDKALDPVRHIIKDKETDLFRWTFSLKIDGDEIPTQAQAGLVAELKALFAKHGASKALKAEREYKPYPSFFTQRHVLYTTEQNLEINRALPIVTQVKTKDIS